MAAPPAAAASVAAAFGKLPLYFIENRGQLDSPVAYYVHGRQTSMYFGSQGITISLTGSSSRWAVALDFLGANPDVHPAPRDPTPALVSYFTGPPEQWRTGLPTYGSLVYPDLWPGIDLAHYGTADRLKYEFVVKPGADPSRIRLAYRGATDVTTNGAGELVVSTPVGSFRDEAPYAYQEIDGRHVPVEMAYALDPAEPADGAYTYGFHVGPYDSALPLILDPAVLVYSGFIGGSAFDEVRGIAVDGSGNAYVVGTTSSTDFPTTPGAPDRLLANEEAFVAKIRADGTGLVYATYLGGSDIDQGRGIALAPGCASDCSAYVTGRAGPGFPTVGAFQSGFGGNNSDAFVTKLSGDGTILQYSSYLGGHDDDEGLAIAVGSAGRAYVTGSTRSVHTDGSPFPITEGAFDELHGNRTASDAARFDAFVSVTNTNETGRASLVYSTYLGGAHFDEGRGIAVDGSGNIYVTGQTERSPSTGTSIPTTPNAYDTAPASSGRDAFIVKLRTSGNPPDQILYGSLLGGDGTDVGHALAVDGSGNVYVAGETGVGTGADRFPSTAGSFGANPNGGTEAFVAKLTLAGGGTSDLIYGGFLGGSGTDRAHGIVLDASRNAYVVGTTSSGTGFPAAGGPDASHNGGTDAFVARVKADGSALLHAGYIGGERDEEGWAVAVDGSGHLYVAGRTATQPTDMPPFPALVGPDTTRNDGTSVDGFVAKLTTLPDLRITKAESADPITALESLTYTVTVANVDTTGARATNVVVTDTLPSGMDFGSWRATPSGPDCQHAGGTVTCTVGTLDSGASVTLELFVTPTTPGTFTNLVTATLAETDANPADNTASQETTVHARLLVSRLGGGSGRVTSNPVGIDCGEDCVGGYPLNQAVTLTAEAAAGSRFDGWGNGCTGTATACSVTMDASKTVTAAFVRQFDLTVTPQGTGSGTITSDRGGIDCGTECSEPYDSGTVVTLTATAAAGSTFVGWSGEGCDGTGTCQVTMDRARTVSATFRRVFALTVTLAGSGGGSVSSNPGSVNCPTVCTDSYRDDTTVTLTATAAAGSRFDGWTGAGCTGTGTCQVAMSEARSVTATFTRIFGLTVARDGTGTGTVTGSGINCGNDCTESYASGTAVTLTATASPDSVFVGWSGGGCTGTGTCEVTLNADTTVTATFRRLFALTVGTAGDGSGSVASDPAGISCPTDCDQIYRDDQIVNLTATPGTGSVFTGWSGACTGTGPCSVRMDAARSVTATFTRNFGLTILKAGSGSGSVFSDPAGISCGGDCSETLTSGTTVTLTATAEAGSAFVGWSGACTGTGPCTLIIDDAKVVTATFSGPAALTVAKDGTGTGTVTSAPAGIDCGIDCSETYASGTTVTLTTTPAADSTFVGWSGSCTGTGTCTLTIDAAKSATATFNANPPAAPATFRLTLAKEGSGTGAVTSSPAGIDCGADCDESYNSGTVVTLAATPAAGSTFTGWSGPCVGIGPCTVTIDAAKAVTATFTADSAAAPSADLAVRTIATPRLVTAGQPFRYVVTVANTGRTAATGVRLTDTLAGVRFAGIRPSQGACWAERARSPSGTVTCELGTLAPGVSATVSIFATAPAPGTVSSEATASAATPDAQPGNNRFNLRTAVRPLPSSLPRLPDLGVDIVTTPPALTVGRPFAYSLTVTNAGTTNATGVQLTDSLIGVRFVAVRPSQGTCRATRRSATGGQLSCTLGTLASGASATVRIVAAPPLAGTAINEAAVTAATPDAELRNNRLVLRTRIIRIIPPQAVEGT